MLIEGIRIAIETSLANRMRTALTVLGVAVGVFVVVIIAAAVHGINAEVATAIEAAGPTSFMVQRFPVGLSACDGSDETCPWLHNPPVTKAEINALAKLPTVLAASVQLEIQAPVAYRGRQLPSPTIEGDSPPWLQVNGGDVNPGRSFTDAENADGAQVVIVNDTLAKTFFGDLDPMDRVITIRNLPFRIIGLYRGTRSFLAGGDDPKAILPIETLRRRLGGDPDWQTVTIKPRPGVARDLAVDEVTVQLREMRGLKPDAHNTFVIATPDQLFQTYKKMTEMFFLVMIVLSGIGLTVGGVGVIAIMMISVTERTREIGIRKALGATHRTILWQFLVEAMTLTGIGAMIGLAVGWGASLAVHAITRLPTSVPPGAILAALGASAVTGVVFGIVPAMRAARLDPVEALRYE
ncbi:MAG TPA: ABC transporter permease [Gemmatimonadaceae bacterium]|jgi:putative ABC transport system permease protein|nr:ABC transporter permease [Gemmatimonadaceae bacterium]